MFLPLFSLFLCIYIHLYMDLTDNEHIYENYINIHIIRLCVRIKPRLAVTTVWHMLG